VGGIIGTIIPAAILIVLGVVYFLQGKPLQIEMAGTSSFPISRTSTTWSWREHLPLLRGHGMNAIHVKEIDDRRATIRKRF